MLKDLLAPITRTEGDDNALDTALTLAGLEGAHLAVLVTVELPAPIASEWGAFPAGVYSNLYQEARGRGEELAAGLRTRLARTPVTTEVRVVDALYLQTSRSAALHARHADLTLITGPIDGEARAAVESLFVDLLMDSGRPVLVVPPAHVVELPAQRVVIAWQPTREASRAVHDALPFLRAAESIDVLLIDPQVGEVAHGEEPGADIATHLARHGLRVRVVTQPDMGQSVATAILHHAHQTGAQMLVAGGYSHSRFREQILGGVTRELLQAAHLPVLFSH